MAQTLAITDHLTTLAEVETQLGLQPASDREFFLEWQDSLPELTDADVARLNLFKQRYLYHRKHGPLAEGAVNFVVISPLLELAGFYDPPFLLRSEVSVAVEVRDREQRYRGRIDALVLQNQLWVLLVESKQTMFNFDVAIPQALSYMMGNSQRDQPSFGFVSNGGQFMFLKLLRQGDDARYGCSDEFSLYKQRNELWDVLKVLKRLGQLMN